LELKYYRGDVGKILIKERWRRRNLDRGHDSENATGVDQPGRF